MDFSMDLLNSLLDSGPISDSEITLPRLFVCLKLLCASDQPFLHKQLLDGFYSGAGSIELLRAHAMELDVITNLGKAPAHLCAHRAGADQCDVINFLKLHRLFFLSIKKNLLYNGLNIRKRKLHVKGNPKGGVVRSSCALVQALQKSLEVKLAIAGKAFTRKNKLRIAKRDTQFSNEFIVDMV
jgi:hypothetical protein